MDGSVAIERNREALKRIVAALVGMAAITTATDAGAPTLPRHLWLAILRLLRPAEAAARRLIIAAARGLVVPPPRPRKHEPKPETVEPLLRSLGIAVVVPAGAALILPRLRGRGTAEAGGSSRLGGGGGGGLQPSVERIPNFSLFDPQRHPFRRDRNYVPAHAAPRILFPGVTEPFSLPRPPSPDDPTSAAHLARRLAALASALDDLPRHALRFARWKARMDANPQHSAGRFRRTTPLRGGRPPGGRLSRFDPFARRRRNVREVDEILAHAHSLAVYALECPDTS